MKNIFITFTIFILLTGCEPNSINPLTSTSRNIIDNRFVGTWVMQDGSGCVHIKSIGNDRLEIKGKSCDKYNFDDYFIVTVYNSTIDNNNYLSIQVHNRSDLKYGYLIAKYSFSDDNKTMKFSYINSVALKDLILSKNLKGKIVDKVIYKSPIITDTSENIEQAIIKYKSVLFSDSMVFTKGTCFSKKDNKTEYRQ